jgi:hypothetical protein
MRMGLAGLMGLVALGAICAGCVRPQEVNEFEYDPTPPAPPEVTVTRDVVIGGDDDDESDDESPPPASVPSAAATATATATATRKDFVWSTIKLGRHEPELFRLGAGLGALGHIDLNPCRDRGLPAGYVHMHLTFHGTGRVVRAAVETPVAPPPEALSCIGGQVEATMVPTFEGGDVNLSKSFYVN